MTLLHETYRGCLINIEIGERATLWDITIDVTPHDGVELIEPFDSQKFKLPKTEELDLIKFELMEEVRLAIDRNLVGL